MGEREEQAVLRLLDEGMSQTEIKDHPGLHKGYICRIRKKLFRRDHSPEKQGNPNRIPHASERGNSVNFLVNWLTVNFLVNR